MTDLNMVLVGDTFVGRPDPDSAFASAMPLLRDADIAFCNLETVVADARYCSPHDRDHRPRTDEWMFAAYLRAGFNVMNQANNPSLYHGLDPLLRSLDVLDAAGVVHGGAGRNLAEARRPAVIERKGTRIAFVCRTSVYHLGAAATADRGGLAIYPVATLYENRVADTVVPGAPPVVRTIPDRGEHRAALEEDIRLASQQADVVVVSWHWGVSPRAGGTGELVDYQSEMGRFAIDAGADMVVGHHPHVLQPIEVYKGRPIVYSLANFVHDHESTLFRKGRLYRTMLLRCLIRDGRIQRLAFVPGLIDGHGPPAFSRPAEAPEIVQHVRDISAPFGTRFTVGQDDVVVELDGAPGR
jgi:poly-gamma-glutamate synthesis protein (capsule biosynthesis protein)